MSVLGTRVRRVEDPRFLTTGGVYVADLVDARLDGAVHVTFVRSTVAHARVVSIDTDEARRATGVAGVFTANDLHGLREPGTSADFPDASPDPMARPWLAADVVRFVGDPIAAVVTERADQSEDAAELVFADFDPLDAVVDPELAATDARLLFPAKGTNTANELAFGHDDDLFEGCEVVVTHRILNQRLAACPLEVRAAAAVWDGDHLTMWCSTQSAHGIKKNLAQAFDLPEAHVRVIAPDVGGGFGAKINLGREEVLVAWTARELGRPARWVETRSESMVALPHGRGQVNTIEIGGTRDGSIDAYRLTVVQDAGAYPGVGAFLPYMTRAMAQGVYDIARVECNSIAVVTNTTTIEAYRGAGRPEAAQAIERAVDLFAAEIGRDPIDVRRRNLIPADAFPYTTATGSVYDNGEYAEALDRALAAAGIDALRAEQARRRDAGDVVQLGIGVAVYVEVTAGPFPGEQEYARVDVDATGGATVFTGSSAHGQGHATSWAMIVNDQLGIPIDRITVVHGDTDRVPTGVGTYGSRSLQVGGVAVRDASAQLVERATQVAAELLEAAAADVVLDTERGTFHVAGTPAIVKSWPEVVAAFNQMESATGHLDGPEDAMSETSTFATTTPTYPFGAHVAVVDVDTETGRVELTRLISCDDAGRILNPLVVEGQRHGGIAQGVAQALFEEVRYDDDGNPITSNLADYAMISATELPAYELVVLETPTPANPLGAKGIGESGTIGSTPAVQNAVVDALAHLGIRHIDLPATPERVWQALQDARGATGEG